MPLKDASGALGVLCATERPSTPFGEEDLALARLLAWAATPRLAPPPAPAPPAAEVAEGESAADEALRADVARGVAAALVEEIEPGPLLHAALRPVAERLAAAPVSLYLVDARSGSLALEACIPGSRADRPRLPRDRGLAGVVLSTGRLIASARPVRSPLRRRRRHAGGRRGEPALLRADPHPRARAGARARLPDTRAQPHARTAELLCTALSAAVRNALLYRSLLESIDDLARARRESNERRADTPGTT